MKKVKYILGALALLALVSCKEDYMMYDAGPKLQFGPPLKNLYLPSAKLADTLKPYTFYYKTPDIKKDTVYFDIYTIGAVSSKDRIFKLEQVQVNNANNAVAGTHYISFDDPTVSKNYVIKAGQAHSLVPVILLRDPSLKTSDVVLQFSIVKNENFEFGESTNLWRKVLIADRLSQPAAWTPSMASSYYGKYSVVKHRFMIDNTGEKWDQTFMSTALDDLAKLNFYLGDLKLALVNYNNAHLGNPLKDEFGDLVVFP